MILTDYTNTMKVMSTPTPIKIIFFVLVMGNVYIYKKYKISRYIEEYLSSYPLTYGSLTFLIFGAFVFPTYGVDTFLSVFSFVTGIGVSLSYLYNIYKDATSNKIGKGWFRVLCVLIFEVILFFTIKHKTIAYTICLFLNLIIMIYESQKMVLLKE